jgi:hypothetical protein
MYRILGSRNDSDKKSQEYLSKLENAEAGGSSISRGNSEGTVKIFIPLLFLFLSLYKLLYLYNHLYNHLFIYSFIYFYFILYIIIFFYSKYSYLLYYLYIF